MRDANLRAVRPKWICETTGDVGEQAEDEAGGEKRKTDIEEMEAFAGEDEYATEDQECGKRRVKPLLDPKLPSEAEV